MNPQPKPDYQWLMSADAANLLRIAQEMLVQRTSSLTISKRLRKEVSPARSALLIEQALIRLRARAKFSLADQMFFTRRGYEQSTSERIAKYKAERFSNQSSLIDICSGIGGDLMSFATRNGAQSTVGIDSDPLTQMFAEYNLALHMESNQAASGSTALCRCKSFEDVDLEEFDAIHVDPDRRGKERTIRGDNFSPSLAAVFDRVGNDANLAIKVAPATPRGNGLPKHAEIEWIGENRECKQQVYWLGALAKNPGSRTATVISKTGETSSVSASYEEIEQTSESSLGIEEYLFEPHSAVLAAGLSDVLATRNGLKRVSRGIPYLTGQNKVQNLLLSQFRTLDVLPMDLRQVSAKLKELEVGHIEVKKRGVEQVVADKFSRLKVKGSERATIILTRHAKQFVAILAKRIPRVAKS